MPEAITFGLVCFSSLLVIMDPLTAAPIFVGLTEGMSADERRRLAIRACLVSLVLIAVFAVLAGVGAALALAAWLSVRPVAQNCRSHSSLPSATL